MRLARLKHGLELQERTRVDEAAGERVGDGESLADAAAGAAATRDVKIDGVETVVGFVGGGVAGVDVLRAGVGGGGRGWRREIGAREEGAVGGEGTVGGVCGGGVGRGGSGGAGVEGDDVHVIGVRVGDLLDAGVAGHGGVKGCGRVWWVECGGSAAGECGRAG